MIIFAISQKDPEEGKIKDFGFLYLRNLDKLFKRCTLEEKQTLIGLTYSERIVFHGNAFKTEKGTDIISLLCRSGKGFSGQKERSQKNFCDLSQEVTPSGFKPETF
jgi:hypothetical protein